jgi:2-methylcitrate dehydratase PrpD
MPIKSNRSMPATFVSGAGVTARLAKFVATAESTALPAPVVAHAKHSFLDALGITLAGSAEPAGVIMAKHAQRAGGTPEATIFGSTRKVPATVAACVNGVSAHVVGFSDFSVPALLHPSVAVLPAVWALAEARQASGMTVLLAYVLGLEVSCKIARALTPDFTARGFHPCAIVGTFGAAVAAGKIIGLDAAVLTNALGIAGVRASGIKVALGSMAKAYAVGHAAEGGVAAAELAELGYTGPENVFEGHDGFFQTFGNGVDSPGWADTLGQPWEFENPGITIKPYPACTRSHPAIDAALDVCAQSDFRPEDIDMVHCEVSPSVLQVVKVVSPRNPMEAKFSLPFCIAAALIDGKVGVDTFTAEKLNDGVIQQLMCRVRPRAVDALAQRGAFAAKVSVHLKSGAIYQCQRDFNLWDHPDVAAPEKNDQLLRKFRECAGRVLGREDVENVITIVDTLDHEPDLKRLMCILRRSSASTKSLHGNP